MAQATLERMDMAVLIFPQFDEGPSINILCATELSADSELIAARSISKKGKKH